MKNNLESLWSGFSSSIIGSGHIKRGLPCQDASAAVTAPRPALIVCDGRGSASRSQDGANGAVGDFISQCAVFEPMLASILDADKADAGRWEMFCRILYRTLMQTKLDLARDHGVPEKEFDFTVAAAVVGTRWIGCFQVGDGSIVLRQNGTPETAFLPDKGEFANQTHFLRENGEARGKFHAKLFSAKDNSGIAITSDGPEHLMFHLATMTPGNIFNMLFDDMQSRTLTRQDIMDYLTRREWDKDPRGQDDRSIAILAPKAAPAVAERLPETEESEAEPSVREETARVLSEQAAAGIEEDSPAQEPSVQPPPPEHDCANVRQETAASPEADPGSGPDNTNRILLLSGGIACGAFLGVFLAFSHLNADLNRMREELHTVSARQDAAMRIDGEKRSATAENNSFSAGGISDLQVRSDAASRPASDFAADPVPPRPESAEFGDAPVVAGDEAPVPVFAADPVPPQPESAEFGDAPVVAGDEAPASPMPDGAGDGEGDILDFKL